MTRLARLLPICLAAACSETPVASAPAAPNANANASASANASANGTPVAGASVAVDFGLPFAKNVDDLFDDVPTVVVDREHVMLDGKVVGDVPTLAALGKLQKIDAEFEALKDKRGAWKSANPGKPFPGVAFLKMHRATKAIVFKDVFQTAAFAGYPNLSIVVDKGGGALGRVNVDAQVPGPPNLGPPEAPEPVLLLALNPSTNVVLVWKRGAEKLAELEMPWAAAFQRDGENVRAPALAAKLTKEWAAQAMHRDPADKKLDQAVVSSDDGAELRDIVAVIDALAETRRAVTGIGARVPAFNVTFSIRTGVTSNGGVPRVAMGATSVNGRLPPEIIQRIVRQNFGGYRLCYEAGLKKDSALAGKVTVRFVIGVDGKVSKVAAEPSTDLPDPSAVACIIKSFGTLSFPPPEGGIVTVVYPIQFTPGSSP